MKAKLQPDFLSVSDLSSLIGISRPAVRDLIATGQMPATRIGLRKLLVRRSTYENWKNQLQPTEAR